MMEDASAPMVRMVARGRMRGLLGYLEKKMMKCKKMVW
jgi:hypothetical protein